jgi:hypothetical protein
MENDYSIFKLGDAVTIFERDRDIHTGERELYCIDNGVVTAIDNINPQRIRVTVNGTDGTPYCAASGDSSPVFRLAKGGK